MGNIWQANPRRGAQKTQCLQRCCCSTAAEQKAHTITTLCIGCPENKACFPDPNKTQGGEKVGVLPMRHPKPVLQERCVTWEVPLVAVAGETAFLQVILHRVTLTTIAFPPSSQSPSDTKMYPGALGKISHHRTGNQL